MAWLQVGFPSLTIWTNATLKVSKLVNTSIVIDACWFQIVGPDKSEKLWPISI